MKMLINRVKLITFDATNTLLKFRVPPWQYYALIAREYGFETDERKIKDRFIHNYKIMWNGHPNFGRESIMWEEWWRRVVKSSFEGQLPKNAHMDSITNRLINDFKTSNCWCLAPGTEQILKYTFQNDIPIGVISNFDPRLHDILKNVGIASKFSFIITSYEARCTKPDKKIFTLALEKSGLNLNPYEVLHIGDDVEKDYEGAKAAGWHAALIVNEVTIEKPPAFKNVFNNLEDLSIAMEHNNLLL